MKAKTIKALVLALCAVLLVVSTVFATMAYLSSTTEVVKNTFTVGNVQITLDEAEVDEYGVEVANANRVIENTYKLLPGHTYVKDPTIHVAEGSEACYLFIKVTNDIAAIEKSGKTVAEQLATNGWTALDANKGIYYKAASIDARSAAIDVAVFSSITIDGKANVADYADKTITVQAYAIQADGFASATAAWTAAPLNAWN